MAGFFEDIGEFFTGDQAKDAQNKTQDIADKTAAWQRGEAREQQALQKEANRQGAIFDTGAMDSMGTNAADYMAKANTAALPQAAQEANTSSIQGARNALMAARSAGLNRGAAALQGGQQATMGYQENLNRNLNQGRDRYQQSAQQFANRGDSLANRAMGLQAGQQQANQLRYQAQTGGADAATAAAAASAAAGGGALTGALFGASNSQGEGKDSGSGVADMAKMAAMASSDKNLKEGIVDSRLLDKARGKTSLTPDLDQLISKVRPVNFRYKEGSGENPGPERKGVLAQDLEQTSMAGNVVDGPKGKMVDTPQQTMSNTNLIVQLAQELYDLKAKMAGGQ